MYIIYYLYWRLLSRGCQHFYSISICQPKSSELAVLSYYHTLRYFPYNMNVRCSLPLNSVTTAGIWIEFGIETALYPQNNISFFIPEKDCCRKRARRSDAQHKKGKINKERKKLNMLFEISNVLFHSRTNPFES